MQECQGECLQKRETKATTKLLIDTSWIWVYEKHIEISILQKEYFGIKCFMRNALYTRVRKP